MLGVSRCEGEKWQCLILKRILEEKDLKIGCSKVFSSVNASNKGPCEELLPEALRIDVSKLR